jgi:hypothetical protein
MFGADAPRLTNLIIQEIKKEKEVQKGEATRDAVSNTRHLKLCLHFTQKPPFKFLLGMGDLKTKVSKILNGGNLTPDDQLAVTESEKYGLLDCNAVLFGDSSKFCRNMLRPSPVVA